jgi:hypothetical protein
MKTTPYAIYCLRLRKSKAMSLSTINLEDGRLPDQGKRGSTSARCLRMASRSRPERIFIFAPCSFGHGPAELHWRRGPTTRRAAGWRRGSVCLGLDAGMQCHRRTPRQGRTPMALRLMTSTIRASWNWAMITTSGCDCLPRKDCSGDLLQHDRTLSGAVPCWPILRMYVRTYGSMKTQWSQHTLTLTCTYLCCPDRLDSARWVSIQILPLGPSGPTAALRAPGISVSHQSIS